MEDGGGKGGGSVVFLYLDMSLLSDCTAGQSAYFKRLVLPFPMRSFHVLYSNIPPHVHKSVGGKYITHAE